MEAYIEVTIENVEQEQASLLIAAFTACGFTGFLEEQHGLKAYIPSSNFCEEQVTAICKKENCAFSFKEIAPMNWNEKWESSFSPVQVGNFAAVRATFHAPVSDVIHEILINPKMSFGTGHHATTYLMIQQMQGMNLFEKRVFDFGTGTGVLAILAEKMGATDIVAIDNDPWSIENANENIRLNKGKKIKLVSAEHPPEKQHFDLILANINRSVLLKFIPALSNLLAPSGYLLLSGILEEDDELLTQAVDSTDLFFANRLSKDGWVSLLFKSGSQ